MTLKDKLKKWAPFVLGAAIPFAATFWYDHTLTSALERAQTAQRQINQTADLNCDTIIKVSEFTQVYQRATGREFEQDFPHTDIYSANNLAITVLDGYDGMTVDTRSNPYSMIMSPDIAERFIATRPSACSLDLD